MVYKRFIIVFTLIMLLSAGSQAQKMYWLKLGGHYSRMTGFESELYTPVAGYHLGAGFEWLTANPVGLKLETLYQSKGFKSFTEVRKSTYLNEVAQRSLDLPLMAVLHTKRMFFEGGLSVNLILSCHQYKKDMLYNNFYDSFTIKESYNHDNFKNPELAYLVGMGVELYKGVSLSARYTQAVTPPGKSYTWKRMSYIQFSLNWRLGNSFTPMPLSVRAANTNSATVRNYRVLNFQNIPRYTFNRQGDGNEIAFRWPAAETSAIKIDIISIESNTGFTSNNTGRLLITDVTFPTRVRLRYNVTNTASGISTESYFEFEVNEAGRWLVTIYNN